MPVSMTIKDLRRTLECCGLFYILWIELPGCCTSLMLYICILFYLKACVSIYFLGKLVRTTHCLRFYHHLSVSKQGFGQEVLHLKETEVKRGETVSLDPIEGVDQEKNPRKKHFFLFCTRLFNFSFLFPSFLLCSPSAPLPSPLLYRPPSASPPAARPYISLTATICSPKP